MYFLNLSGLLRRSRATKIPRRWSTTSWRPCWGSSTEGGKTRQSTLNGRPAGSTSTRTWSNSSRPTTPRPEATPWWTPRHWLALCRVSNGRRAAFQFNSSQLILGDPGADPGGDPGADRGAGGNLGRAENDGVGGRGRGRFPPSPRSAPGSPRMKST